MRGGGSYDKSTRFPQAERRGARTANADMRITVLRLVPVVPYHSRVRFAPPNTSVIVPLHPDTGRSVIPPMETEDAGDHPR